MSEGLKVLENEREYLYTIFRVGEMYYAENRLTGKVDYCGVDAATVIQNAIDRAKETQLFEASCRFGGTCTDKRLYEACVKDERMKNNWMCGRDGILKRSDVPLEFKEAQP